MSMETGTVFEIVWSMARLGTLDYAALTSDPCEDARQTDLWWQNKHTTFDNDGRTVLTFSSKVLSSVSRFTLFNGFVHFAG